MQKRKEHTEMEILSLPTAENQKEFITFPSWLQEHNVLGQEWPATGGEAECWSGEFRRNW